MEALAGATGDEVLAERLRAAVDALVDLAAQAETAAELAAETATGCDPAHRADAAVASLLCDSAVRSCAYLVELNLTTTPDDRSTGELRLMLDSVRIGIQPRVVRLSHANSGTLCCMSTDAEVVVSLVARCRSGDQDAWAELVRLYSRYVFAICQQGFRLSEPDAEDVFQEVFVRVYQHLDDIRDDASLRAWIGQVTRRLCLDRLRAAKRAPAMEDEWEAADPDDPLDRIELAMDVDRMMAELPESCADILDRFFRRDESYAVIGDALSIPAGTIASRISRCLSRLRELMEGRRPAARTSGET